MEELEKNKKRRIPPKSSLRNLPQYKNLPDEEFEEFYYKTILGIEKDEILKERFDRIYRQFEAEYDLSEMLPNDRLVMERLINALILLADYQREIFNLKQSGISNNISQIATINKMIESLSGDISKMQEDLKISRKLRKNDKEQSVITFIEDLKKKAARFAEQKMHYIFCPKCGTLLATVWWLHPDRKMNKISLKCVRVLESGEICGEMFELSAKQLQEMGGSNATDKMPESMR